MNYLAILISWTFLTGARPPVTFLSRHDFASDSLKVSVKVIDHLYKNPGDSSVFIKFRFRFPVVISAPNPVLRDSLNENTRNFIYDPIFEKNVQELPDSLFQDLVNEYISIRKRFPDYHFEWDFERYVDIIYQNPAVVSMRLKQNSYTGGAHPVSYSYYRSLDAKTGKILMLDDLFKPGYRPKLIRLAEMEFRKIKGINADKSFSDAGYWFKNDDFKLSDNCALTQKGLILFYNIYEIAPYYMGSTNLLIPYQEIKSLLRDEYLSR